MSWEPSQWIDVLIRMTAAFFAGAAGVALWSQTRETSWVWVIASSVLAYLDIMLRFLDEIGLADLEVLSLNGISVLSWILGVLSSLSLAVGLVLALKNIQRLSKNKS